MSKMRYREHDSLTVLEDPLYALHVQAMTIEALYSKAEIAEELAWRDMQLATMTAERDELKKDAERWRFFRIADWADWNSVFRIDHDGLSLPVLLDKATDAAMEYDAKEESK